MSSDPGRKPLRATDPKTGEVIRYQTDQLVGSGASAEVFLARRMPSGKDVQADAVRRVALKIVSKPKWKGRLLDEAKVLKQLQEDVGARMRDAKRIYRIVRIGADGRVLEVDSQYRDDPDYLIELEYLEGQTLDKWLAEWSDRAVSPVETVDEVLRLASELGEVLEQLGPYTHRDIKPENLMRTHTGLKIFDFNVAKDLSNENLDLTAGIGTQEFMAPEVRYGEAYDESADLWSIGVILWKVVFRKAFIPTIHTRDEKGSIYLVWSEDALADWSEAEREVVRELLDALLCDRVRRADASRFKDIVDRLRAPRLASRRQQEQLGELDLIGLIAELQPGGLISVVTDTSGRVPREELQRYLRKRMHVQDPLEDWLAHEIERAASTPPEGPVLFLLGGNAGDGKSHLLWRLLRVRLAERPELAKRIHYIADATHALSPDADPFERLHAFFEPFADESTTTDDRVHVIAMNTGMVIQCFEEQDPNGRFATLYQELQRQLGLRRTRPDEAGPPWRVEVMNLDLRNLLAPGSDDLSFFERMAARLDPEDEEGIPAALWEGCVECVARATCPVRFNLAALREPQARRAVAGVLRRASLDAEVHLSPRNLWGFLYRLVTGGLERYDVRDFDGSRCDVVRDKVALNDGPWMLSGQFTELLFQEPGAGTPWDALAEQDPAYSPSPRLDQLHTRISVKSELDNAPEILADIGGEPDGTLHGMALSTLYSQAWFPETATPQRRDAAVRRHALLHPETHEEWEKVQGGLEFPAVLEAYEAYSRGASLTDAHKQSLATLRELVENVFLLGNGIEVGGVHYLKVSQPSARADAQLLVKADRVALGKVFRLQKILVPDPHVVAHRGREHLLKHLGYRPVQVTLSILGVQLLVDRALYTFLLRVDAGQKPSVRELAEFQTLLYLGDRVGNHLARAESGQAELFLWDENGRALHRLAVGDFGETELSRVGGM